MLDRIYLGRRFVSGGGLRQRDWSAESIGSRHHRYYGRYIRRRGHVGRRIILVTISGRIPYYGVSLSDESAID
jgi:hypothetical protein